MLLLHVHINIPISISKAFIFGSVSKSMTSISDVNTPYIFLKFCNTSNKRVVAANVVRAKSSKNRKNSAIKENFWRRTLKITSSFEQEQLSEVAKGMNF